MILEFVFAFQSNVYICVNRICKFKIIFLLIWIMICFGVCLTSLVLPPDLKWPQTASDRYPVYTKYMCHHLSRNFEI